MKFCDYCDNMLYISVNEDKKLTYTCKNCNFNRVMENSNEDSTVLLDDGLSTVDNKTCIMNFDYTDELKNFYQFLNKDIKYDKTLPHVNNIKCPNTECKKETDTIYIKYDNPNMKYLYFCCNCEKFWK